MKKNLISVKPTYVLSSVESNDIYMELTMCILTNQTNLNNLKFTDDYINGVVNNKDNFIGIPLVANREMLEKGSYNSLTHELNTKTGLLETDSVGTFVDFWTETEDEVLKLMGKVKVYKRYPNVCNAMLELYESGDLEFSCEMFAYGYTEINEETNEKTISYEYQGRVNSLIGSCIVTHPAETQSKAHLLVAEAVQKDMVEGGDRMDKQTIISNYNKGNEVRVHGAYIETAALKTVDISNQIYNIVNPIDAKSNYRKTNYWISDVYFDSKKDGYAGFVILEDWNDYETLWKLYFNVENDIVTLEGKDTWVEGYKGFIPKGMDIDSLGAKVDSLENTIIEQAAAHKAIEEEKNMLEAEVNALKPFKEQMELNELKTKRNQLNNKYGKILSPEIMTSDIIVSAIEELNEDLLKNAVIDQVEIELAARDDNESKSVNVIVTATKHDDLIPQTLLQKYNL